MNNILTTIHQNQDKLRNFIQLFNAEVASIFFDESKNQLTFKVVVDTDKMLDKKFVNTLCNELKYRHPNNKFEDKITVTFYDDFFKAPKFSSINNKSKSTFEIQNNFDAFLCALVPGYKFILKERLKKECQNDNSKVEELNKQYTDILSCTTNIVNTLFFDSAKNDEIE